MLSWVSLVLGWALKCLAQGLGKKTVLEKEKMQVASIFSFLYPHKRSLAEYTGVTLSVRLSVCHEILSEHNFKSIKTSNFKLHIQIGHIVEKCNVQEP